MITKNQLTRPAKVVEVDIAGLGLAKIRELTRSRKQELDLWLQSESKNSTERDKLLDLKIVTLCLEDESGELMFPFETDQAFNDFAKEQAANAAGPWTLISHEVLKVNGYITETEEDLLKK